jgi:hypothetical protein
MVSFRYNENVFETAKRKSSGWRLVLGYENIFETAKRKSCGWEEIESKRDIGSTWKSFERRLGDEDGCVAILGRRCL